MCCATVAQRGRGLRWHGTEGWLSPCLCRGIRRLRGTKVVENVSADGLDGHRCVNERFRSLLTKVAQSELGTLRTRRSTVHRHSFNIPKFSIATGSMPRRRSICIAVVRVEGLNDIALTPISFRKFSRHSQFRRGYGSLDSARVVICDVRFSMSFVAPRLLNSCDRRAGVTSRSIWDSQIRRSLTYSAARTLLVSEVTSPRTQRKISSGMFLKCC